MLGQNKAPGPMRAKRISPVPAAPGTIPRPDSGLLFENTIEHSKIGFVPEGWRAA
jgi:hypothetical protein